MTMTQDLDKVHENALAINKFVNGTDVEVVDSPDGDSYPTVQKFLKDKDSEINAAADSILAKSHQWAEEAEDVEVDPGAYSAKHHALKAAASAATVDTAKIIHTIGSGAPNEGYDKDQADSLFASKLSPIAQSVMTKGSLALESFVVTKNFAIVPYAGIGGTQNVATGIPSNDLTDKAQLTLDGYEVYLDRTTNEIKATANHATLAEDAVISSGEAIINISKVHIKARTAAYNNVVADGIRGAHNIVFTDATNAETTYTSAISFNTTGVTVDAGFTASTNFSGVNYVLYQTLYTHVKWGTTNQGKFYIEAYNPVTREGMIYYLGSGVTGHELSHSIGKELDLVTVKQLSGGGTSWSTLYSDESQMFLNLTNDPQALTGFFIKDPVKITLDELAGRNGTDLEYISYYKAKSETWGIYEYTGTGGAGNFVETIDVYGVARKVARGIIKRVDTTGDWVVFDNVRGDNWFKLNDSITEFSVPSGLTFESNGLTIDTTALNANASGGRYILLVEFDTNADGGGSYFNLPTDNSNLNVINSTFTFTNGKDEQGFKNSYLANITETINFAGIADGLAYVYKKLSDGSYGFDAVEPVFDTSTGLYSGKAEAISYLGKVMVVSETPQYVDYSWDMYKNFMEDAFIIGDVKTLGKFIGGNACTAFVNFDGTTTPPTIKSSINISAVIRLGLGNYLIYFTTKMDNTNYVGVSSSSGLGTSYERGIAGVEIPKLNGVKTVDAIEVQTANNSSSTGNGAVDDREDVSILIFGGKG